MRRLGLVLFTTLSALGFGLASTRRNELSTTSTGGARRACQILQEKLPHLVAFPGSTQFINDNDHWAVTSERNSTCSVEPHTVDDVSFIIKVVGRPDIRAQFAIKSGGHAYNPGFSSTPGVQISMSRFNNVSVNAEKGTATIGVGLTWDQVYQMIEPFGIMVVGGRYPGVGVGGLSLGGGYSWKTNQFGLTIDTIASFQLVLPTGKQVHVTNQSFPDLFFALKGGQNNFGIVTSIEFETHPQTLIWGGSITYAGNMTYLVNQATADFSVNNTDPKAQMIVTYASVSGQSVIELFPFYDAPTPPSGIFDAFLSIPSLSANVSTQSFVDFIYGAFGTGEGGLGIGPFGIVQHVIPVVQYTVPILEEIANQVNTVEQQLSAQTNGSIVVVTIAAEPFLKPNSHNRGGAYPHIPSRQITPASPFIGYQTDPSLPAAVQAARRAALVPVMKRATHSIQARAVLEGQSQWNDVLYPNYALSDTPLESLFGSNVAKLRAIARKYDPHRVMTLTGGFSFLE